VDKKNIERLKQSYRMTLARFVETSERAAGHLSLMTPDTSDPLARANTVASCRNEGKALESYLKARVALLQCLLDDRANSI
jgi:hypothetical protein